ncbi:MAG: 4-(cytidine 5'-diphospho)-2-C-methyl-D-erythritol kinase [Lacipirellulaceae bacterium]
MQPPAQPAVRSVLAPAKLNLTLEVGDRRADGYHEVQTLIVPLRWGDTLLVERRGDSPDIELAVTGPQATIDVPTDERNLVVKALGALREAFGVAWGARATLVKRVPSQAGLGGGSSDAAAALVAGASVWGLLRGAGRERRVAELSAVAARIGSDVPFFVHAIAGGASAAICRGRGERVEVREAAGGVPVVVVKPSAGLSTAAVFAESRADPRAGLGGDSAAAVDALEWRDWRGLRRACGNALAPAAERLAPWLAEVLQRMDRVPTIVNQMSGSGSACFALCPTIDEARRLAARLRSDRGIEVFVTATR